LRTRILPGRVVSASLARSNPIKRRRVMALATIYPEPEKLRPTGSSSRLAYDASARLRPATLNPAAVAPAPFAKSGARKMAKVATSA
jgi:hypothetical protein